MTEPMTQTLDVPGAVLTYDIRDAEAESTAPVLLMIASPMDASGFTTLAEHFRDRTVVTYDPRGVGRSERADGRKWATPDEHADDLHRLISALGTTPVDIFASSGGAVNGLVLVAQHPEQVRTLVAHEPPAAQVLPDREQALAAVADVHETYEKGAATMKLTTMTQVTVDGVMQGNGGASDEDRRGGFERGGWAMGVFDTETFTFITQTYQRADAFLFGRRTYEIFAPYWGAMDPGSHPIADALNTKPKYLASTTLTEPRWANTTVLAGDLAAAIGELKAEPAGELQVHGSGILIRWLLENDLVDEINLLIVPVVLGQGARLFPDTGPDIALDLVDSRADSKGVTIQVYRPAGRPQYATATPTRSA